MGMSIVLKGSDRFDVPDVWLLPNLRGVDNSLASMHLVGK